MLRNLVQKNIFLIDSAGAFTSCAFLGLVLPRLNIGLPDLVLHILSLVALCFAIYSLVCHLRKKFKNTKLLSIIMLANLSYTAASLYILISYYGQISFLGKAYFIIEIALIFIVAFLEKDIILQLKATQPSKDTL